MSAPTIPQRPDRSQDAPAASHGTMEPPKIPPRPARHTDRSISRDREASTRSPLNDAFFSSNATNNAALQSSNSNASGSDPFKRPPSVATLPLIGQEGNEYASFDNAAEIPPAATSATGSPSETRNVASDLPLHAPKASAAPAVTRTRVATVTCTDTEKASIAGIGKPTTEVHHSDLPLRSPPNNRFRPPSATSTERPGSSQMMQEGEHEGIPSFGVTVPMYPNAGDVQAPTPGPGSGTFPGGVGFFNDGSRPTTGEGRKPRSAQGFHNPPGSYGLHGHGMAAQDRFEKAWYQRHPDELAKEEVVTHSPASALQRPSWAMSSDELNKLVHESGKNSPAFGTNPEMIGAPTEAIGYQASLEYTSSKSSSQYTPPHSARSRLSRPTSQSYAESPLRKTFSAQEASRASDAIEDENDAKHHVNPPLHRTDKIGGAGYDPPVIDLGPHGGNTDARGGWIHERGTGTPILASDELAKDRTSEYLHPAVSPAQPLSEDDYFSGHDSETSSMYSSKRKNRSRPSSRPGSRPSSIHAPSSLYRFVSHEHGEGIGTPLEEIEEYEPLFKDDENDESEKPKTAADRLKRPEMERRRFPSQDIWEDTPTSLQLQTTVDTPEDPAKPVSAAPTKAAVLFESPEKEKLRRGEVIESEREAALRDPTKAKPKFKPEVMNDRPGLPQRFPSRDIWEDTPDSLRLETTVGNMDQASTNGTSKGLGVGPVSPTSPTDRPAVPAGPMRDQAKAEAGVPKVPARPQRQQQPQQQPQATSPTDRKAPMMPERPKPQVPQRPTKKLSGSDQPLSPPAAEGVTREKSEELASAAVPAMGASTTKPKPAVPARPQGGSKIASLKAGFMSDLNSRLQLGPQPPPKPQTQDESTIKEDKTPLNDARKGRARGPVRRKPAISPSSTSESKAASTATSPKLAIATPRTIWSIATSGAEDLIVTPSSSAAPKISQAPSVTAAQLEERPTASPLATNTAGETLLSKANAPSTSSGVLAHEASQTMDARAHRESEEKKAALADFETQRIGHVGDVPEPVVEPSLPSRSVTEQQAPALAPSQEQEQEQEEEQEAQGAPLEAQMSHHKSIEVPRRALDRLEGEGSGAPLAAVASSSKETTAGGGSAPAPMETLLDEDAVGDVSGATAAAKGAEVEGEGEGEGTKAGEMTAASGASA